MSSIASKLKVAVVDPEYPADISINTLDKPIQFKAIFKRPSTEAQESSLERINAWRIRDSAEEGEVQAADQQKFVEDSVIRFEGLFEMLPRMGVELDEGEVPETADYIEMVLGEPLLFTKVLNAAILSVTNAGIERSKN